MPTASNDIITLCMIIKNEAHIIKELLENVYKYIDHTTFYSIREVRIIVKPSYEISLIPETLKAMLSTTNIEIEEKEYKRYQFFHFGWARSYAMR